MREREVGGSFLMMKFRERERERVYANGSRSDLEIRAARARSICRGLFFNFVLARRGPRERE